MRISDAVEVKVKVGQVWEHHETVWSWKRNERVPVVKTRTLQVLELVDHGHYSGSNEPGARCHVVETGRKVVVTLRRMKPGRTRGYRLVSDSPPAFALEAP